MLYFLCYKVQFIISGFIKGKVRPSIYFVSLTIMSYYDIVTINKTICAASSFEIYNRYEQNEVILRKL